MNSPFADFGHRLFLCHGAVRDRFAPASGTPVPFDFFLHGHLGALGYDTRLYYSHRGLYFLDRASRDRVIDGEPSPVSVYSPPAEPAINARRSPLAPAPGGLSLRRRAAASPPPAAVRPTPVADAGPMRYPDLNRLTEILPTLRRLTAPGASAVAIVFDSDHLADFSANGPTVEQFRGFLDTFRTLPPSQRAILIFVFGQELEQLAGQLRHKPALNLLLNLDAQGQPQGIAKRVPLGAPERDEVGRLVHYYRLRRNLDLDWPTLDKSLLRLTAALKTGTLNRTRHSAPESGGGRLLQLEQALEQLVHTSQRLDPDSVCALTDQTVETQSARQRLGAMIGLETVKTHVQRRIKQHQHLSLNQTQDTNGGSSDLWRLTPTARPNRAGEWMHLVLAGNPGTGKTTLARLIGEIYQEAGLLELGHTIEAKRADLVGGYVGQTALKTRECIERALGGVLFIDEAYSLVEGGDNDFGREAITTLIDAMSSHQDRLCVIFAGYPADMDRLVAANAGFASRCTRIDLPDYGAEQLQAIFEQCVRRAPQPPVVLDAELQALLPRLFQEVHDQRAKDFGNAREIETLFRDMRTAVIDELDALAAKHCFSRRHLPAPYQGYLQQIEASAQAGPLAELDALVGLRGVKQQIRELLDLIAFEQRRQEQSGASGRIALSHYLFLGNPGTGKTTVARLMAEQFKRLGLLKTARLTELTASELSGQTYLGQPERIARERFMDAIGGVLFIDEAHQLAQPHGYGANVLGTLTPLLSRHTDELVVIFAGYRDRMQAIHDIDPGLKRRFKSILFEDFTAEELVCVFIQAARKDGMECTETARESLLELFAWMLDQRTPGFGNAGTAVEVFQRAKSRLAQRVNASPDRLDLNLIAATDIPDPNHCGDLL